MRLDSYLFDKKFFNSRTKAKQSIDRGEVYVDGNLVTKNSFDLDENVAHDILIISPVSFVSLGGYKLFKGLNDFNFNVNGLICADIGASTGGFTDCLIQNGVKKVYAVDLNDDLLHDSLKSNNKIVRIIKNAKYLTINDFNDKLDLIVADLSFISLENIFPVFSELLEDGKFLITLIKPQFEMEIKQNFKNGIIKDAKIRENICKKLCKTAINYGFNPLKITKAPEQKGKNVEYVLLFNKGDFSNKNIFENFIF